jgi:hypothetical protein
VSRKKIEKFQEPKQKNKSGESRGQSEHHIRKYPTIDIVLEGEWVLFYIFMGLNGDEDQHQIITRIFRIIGDCQLPKIGISAMYHKETFRRSSGTSLRHHHITRPICQNNCNKIYPPSSLSFLSYSLTKKVTHLNSFMASRLCMFATSQIPAMRGQVADENLGDRKCTLMECIKPSPSSHNGDSVFIFELERNEVRGKVFDRQPSSPRC